MRSLSKRMEKEPRSNRRLRWVETWYLAYALLGATMAGLAPIRLPVTVARAHGAGQVGLVMAALSLGGLTAPLWGMLADRYRLHRWLLVCGLVFAAIGLAGFALTTVPMVWLGLALLAGIGAAAAATVANLFVVEMHPQVEWDDRIGWLQTFYGGGQVGGLFLAGLAGHTHPRIGLLVAAGLTGLAVVPGWLKTQTPPWPVTPMPALLHPARHGEWAVGSPQRLFHHLHWSALRQTHSPFGLFLVAWWLSFAGAAAVFSLYPVLMQQVYGMPAALSSVGYGVAAALALTLYSPAGRWSGRFGPASVMRIALGVRLLAFVGLLVLGLMHPGDQMWLGLLAFVVVVLTWSLLSVSGTTITARLSPGGEGPAMGLFNATTAMAGVIGSGLGGWLAGRWGYAAALELAMGGVACGWVLAFRSDWSNAEVRTVRKDGCSGVAHGGTLGTSRKGIVE